MYAKSYEVFQEDFILFSYEKKQHTYFIILSTIHKKWRRFREKYVDLFKLPENFYQIDQNILMSIKIKNVFGRPEKNNNQKKKN